MAKYTDKYGLINRSIKMEYLAKPVSLAFLAEEVLCFPPGVWIIHSYREKFSEYRRDAPSQEIEVIFDNYLNVYFFYQVSYAGRLGYLNEILYDCEKEVVSFTDNRTTKFYEKRNNNPSMKLTDSMIDVVKFIHDRKSFDTFMPTILSNLL
jgi:hypothetical protein